ncbi:hypothetical protein [Flavobacterium franklandianum]|uniref:Lipoprotein n=1 Tax=Flavobacterium franklandianum TaxID=2594430 RepID=A0A553C6Y8_9FLAO|nr:hypothetical protein [Flavobacterium franklandianum]TRX16289.1 hypothetical protein FNW17_14340 [Flavobacterium franklandianum]
MKKLTLIATILLFCGCSPKISKYFEQNKYIRNYNIHIVNDSLQFYFKTPGDITYTTNREELKKIIRKGKIKTKDSVLVYGKSTDPLYEYFVTASENHKQNNPKHLIIFDTIINRKTIQFLGNPLAENSYNALKIDLENIFKSLEVGKNYRKEICTVMDIVKKHQNSNKYFATLNEIIEFPTYDKQEEWTKLQMELTFASFLEKNDFYDNYLNQLESKFKPNDTISKLIKENSSTDQKVIETIINEAKNHKILMINENHFYPNHRLLVSDLLIKLKEIGYNYLALEGLDVKQDSLLNIENVYPTLKTGFYTVEQNYSNLIRKAKELGYEFVAYENFDNSKDREIGQAENIYDKTFKLNPNSKVLVLSGIDHILEKQTREGKKWMATIFKEKYNIDPLTISQTHLNSYRKIIDEEYSIFKSKLFNNERLNSVDFLVLNNKKTVNLTTGYYYQNISETDVQVELFYGDEILNDYDYLKNVPYFSTILKNGKKYNLPIDKKRGMYLYTYDKNGKRIDNQIISPANN